MEEGSHGAGGGREESPSGAPAHSEGGRPEQDSARPRQVPREAGQARGVASYIVALVRLSSAGDWLLTVVGTLAAMVHGAAFPVAMFIFGDITNAFVSHSVSRDLAQSQSVVVGGRSIANITDGVVNCTETYLPGNFTLSQLLAQLISSQYTCLDNSSFIAEINMLIYIFIGIACGAFLMAVIQVWALQTAGERQVQRLRLQYYHAVLRQDVAWFDRNSSGELSNTISDNIDKVYTGLGENIALLIQWISTFLTAIVVGFVRDWRLALLMLAIVPFLALAAGVFSVVGSVFARREQKAYSLAGAVTEEVFSAIKTVISFGGDEKESLRYGTHLEAGRQTGVLKGVAVGSSVALVYFLLFVTYSAAFWFGGWLVASSRAEAGDVITVFFSILVGAFYLGQAGPNTQNLVSSAGAVGHILEVIDRQPEIDIQSHLGLVPASLQPTIHFKQVSFSYPLREDTQVLRGLDVRVDAGRTVAIVGASGSGKSTMLQLIQRFYDVGLGELLIGDIDVRTLNLKWLRSQIGIVSQEPVLFATSITENIRYGREDATMEEVEQAAKNANAYDFIMTLPDTFDTHVGERGTQLSGGQKQRIAIARALVANPKILLLDEATSALDNESEKIVQDALDRAQEGRTTIVIAHRLSTIQTADTIVVLEEGRVVEEGSHWELLERKGLYHHMLSIQDYRVLVPVERSEHLGRRRTLTTCLARGRSLNLSRRTTGTSRHHAQTSSPKLSRSNTVQFLGMSQKTFRRISDARQPSRHYQNRSRGSSHSSASHYPSRSISGSRLSPKTPRGSTSSHAATATPPEQGDVELLSVADPPPPGPTDPPAEPPTRAPPEPPTGVVRRPRWADKQDPADADLVDDIMDQEKEKSVTLIRILRILPEKWWLLVVGGLASLVNGCVFPAFAIIFGEVLAVFSRPVDMIFPDIHLWGALFLVLGSISAVCILLKNTCFSVYGESMTARLRERSFSAILKQDVGWFDEEANSTAALSRLLSGDAAQVQGAAGVQLGSLIESGAGLVAALVIGLYYSWILSLVIVALMPVIALAASLHVQVVTGAAPSSAQSLAEAHDVAHESFENIDTVIALDLQDRFYRSFRSKTTSHYRLALVGAFFNGLTYAVSQVIIFFAYIIAFRFGAFQVTLAATHLLAIPYQDVYRVFAAIIFSALAIGFAGSFAPDLSKAKQAAGRVFAVLNLTPEVDAFSEDGIKLDADSFSAKIAMDEVDFVYPSRQDALVLHGLTVGVEPGHTLALVGPSGSGKSTVVSLVERFYDPISGTIEVDGHNLRDLNVKWLRSQIGLVSQEPVLFDTSIAENVRYGANFREVTDEEVIEAAKAANIHTFIETLPEGYSTNVGERGTQLSGGQKQRIAIARALVRDPKILLLDEATSALDTESEKIVQDALDRARKGRTTIVIAHRLSTIRTADTIAVIRTGRVTEHGSHAELLQRRGFYYKLHTYQHSS